MHQATTHDGRRLAACGLRKSSRAPREAQAANRALPGAGFTLIEVLVVVVIIGIAAAVVVPHILDTGSLTIQAASRHVIADLLVAQNEAIARAETRFLIFDAAAESYRLADQNQNTLDMPFTNGPYVVNFATDRRFNGVLIDAVNFGGQTRVSFDELGTPSSGGTIDVSSGTHRYRVTVTPFTGRVRVAPITGG